MSLAASARRASRSTRARSSAPGRNARVDFKGVPIIYLPWLSFPLGTERKSGFLFPSIGHSTRSGLQFAVPYYWNIAPATDLTFEPVYYAQRGLDIAGELRYLTAHQRGALEFNYLPNDQVTRRLAPSLQLEHVAELPRDSASPSMRRP